MLTQQLDAVHLSLCAALSVKSALWLPDGPAETLQCPRDFIVGRGSVRHLSEHNAENTGGVWLLSLAVCRVRMHRPQ